MVWTVKQKLHQYGLQKGHTRDWDLQLPWLAMEYRFNQQASLTSFSPFFLFFGRHLELQASIQYDVTIVVNLDDPLMWLQTCEQ